MEPWEAWLHQQRLNNRMHVKYEDLDTLAGWNADNKSVRRHDDKFFSIVGVHVEDGERSWDQPMIEEGSEGVAILLTDGMNFLLQAVAEPGNQQQVRAATLLRPTLQSSQSHWKLAQPQRAELASETNFTLASVLAQQDGSRFFGKQVRLEIDLAGQLEIWVAEHGGLKPNERIFTGRELAQAIFYGECNQFLRELAGVYWALGFGQQRR